MLQSTLKNRTIFCGDNLAILRGINTESIDLIYLDPPFNTNKYYTAPSGTSAEGASFRDIFKEEDVKDEWVDIIKESQVPLANFLASVEQVGQRSNKYYLCYMAIRLIECQRILKGTGSLYLHCDPTMSHYLKLGLDCIFGESNFRNEIIWRIGWVSGFKTQKKGWIRNHDTILYYVKDRAKAKPTFNKEYIPYPKGYTRRDGSLPKGKGIPLEDTWNCHSGDSLDSIMIKSFSREKTGYPTQKPLALLERIIKASSNEGDLVLDPFCGCATTCVASEKINRQWVGIDVSQRTYEEVKKRLKKEIKSDSFDLAKEVVFRQEQTDILQRTDLAKNELSETEIKTKLYGVQMGMCKGCRILFNYRNMVIAQIQTRAKGGGNNIDNLQLLCSACKSQKGIGTVAKPKEKLKN